MKPLNVRFVVPLLLLLSVPAFASPFSSPRGYSLDFPYGWAMSAPGGGVDVLFQGPKLRPVAKISETPVPPTISVTAGNTSTGSSAPDALNIARQQLIDIYTKQVSSFKLVDSGTCSLGALPGFFVQGTYTSSDSPEPTEFRFILGVHGSNSYSFTEAALAKDFDAVSPAFLATEKSFQESTFDTHAYTSPYGFQLTPPAGWTTKPETSPNLVTLLEVVPDGEFPANVLVRARTGLGLDVDIDRVYSLRDQWTIKYSQLPGYAPVDQGLMTIGGEKALYTIWTQNGDNPPRRMREWHVMLPRNGVLIEFIGSCLDSDHVRYDRQIRDAIRSWIWCPPTASTLPDPATSPAPTQPAATK